jgi:uncharacterized protein (TIGR00255 family)
MTGFGRATYEDDLLWVQVEVKSVNSKYADINLQLPKFFTEYTQSWKNLVASHLTRGKIELTLQLFYKQTSNWINTVQEPLFKAYYHTFKKLAQEVEAPTESLFELALKSPGVLTPATEKDKKEPIQDPLIQQKVEATIVQALTFCQQTRIEEGKILATRIASYLVEIALSVSMIEKLDKGRLSGFKQKLLEKLSLATTHAALDTNRLEQELVYYLEKSDITEEKVRLSAHLTHFTEVMNNETIAGKKLGFIAQELSREVNTLGVKANDASVQKHAIIIKNEIEKIKEQLQNIL